MVARRTGAETLAATDIDKPRKGLRMIRSDITVEMLHQLLEVDYETGQLWWKYRPLELFKTKRAFSTWNRRFNGVEALCTETSYGYKSGQIFSLKFKTHVVIWSMANGRWPRHKLVVNHINMDGRDNRLINLEEATYQKNSRNCRMAKNNTSGHNGVSRTAGSKTWRADITVSGKRIYLASFKSIEDAIACRKKAEREFGFSELHGQSPIRS